MGLYLYCNNVKSGKSGKRNFRGWGSTCMNGKSGESNLMGEALLVRVIRVV